MACGVFWISRQIAELLLIHLGFDRLWNDFKFLCHSCFFYISLSKDILLTFFELLEHREGPAPLRDFGKHFAVIFANVIIKVWFKFLQVVLEFGKGLGRSPAFWKRWDVFHVVFQVLYVVLNAFDYATDVSNSILVSEATAGS